MIYELDKETINFLCRKKITFNQFAICLLVHKRDTATIIRIGEEVGQLGDCMIPLGNNKFRSEIDDLIERGYLIHEMNNPKLQYEIDNLIVTEKFKHGFIDEKLDMFQEFWELYPKNLMISGLEVSSKTCDYDELSQKYLKAIKNSPRLHKEIIGKLVTMKENSAYAQMGIEKFVGSRQWEQIDEQPRAKTRSY